MRAIPPAHLFPSYADSQALIVLQVWPGGAVTAARDTVAVTRYDHH